MDNFPGFLMLRENEKLLYYQLKSLEEQFLFSIYGRRTEDEGKKKPLVVRGFFDSSNIT
jgi:hypothetical protein